MSTLIKEVQAVKIWFDNDNLWLLLSDGRQISTPLSYFPRLLQADEKERNKYIISGGGTGLHWEELDEDISVTNLILGIGDQTTN